MGQVISWPRNYENKRLCDDILDDDSCFIIRIYMYCGNPIDRKYQLPILESLQYTRSVYSFIDTNCVTLLFNPNKSSPFLRSNVVSDIIASLSSEVSMWLTKNTNIDLRMITVHIDVGEYTSLLNDFKQTISDHKLTGNLYSFDQIDDTIIDSLK